MPDFAFEKKLGVNEIVYGNPQGLLMAIEKLFACMKETNKIHNHDCEFFRLDFRQAYFDEQSQFPIGSMIMYLQWGSKKELKEKDGVD